MLVILKSKTGSEAPGFKEMKTLHLGAVVVAHALDSSDGTELKTISAHPAVGMISHVNQILVHN